MNNNINKKLLNQQQFIHNYNAIYREPFNRQLFERSDEKIIYFLKNMFKSCERSQEDGGYFTIKINGFQVIENYDEVIQVLRDYQENIIKKSSKKDPTDNRFNYIDLKESDLKLLIVTFYVETGAKFGNIEKDMFDVIVAVPRVIDKFYFKLNGNVRYSINQIVDASTYNNKTSNNKKYTMITNKTPFQPIKIYRSFVTVNTVTGEEVTLATYHANVFTKSVEAIEYIFAKMGLNQGLQFLGLSGVFGISDKTPKEFNPHYYYFLPKKVSNIYIWAPRYLVDNNHVVQHCLYTICNEFVRKNTTIESVFTRDYWLDALGRHFNISNPNEKGVSVLNSLDLIYDLTTYLQIRLPEEEKKNVYCLLRWLIYEFNSLAKKDNLDTTKKRLRCEEYIASLYGYKLSTAIYALSDMGEKIDTKYMKRKLIIDPMHLITMITSDPLINFRDMMTDNDSYLPLKYTYKGKSGIGESGSNAIPGVYKLVHPTNIGIVDLDSSSSQDPGISGCIVPLVKLYKDNYFSEFKEPCSYRKTLIKQMEHNNKLCNKKEVMTFNEKIIDWNFKISNEKSLHLGDKKNNE